jgi:hypothetical protein
MKSKSERIDLTGLMQGRLTVVAEDAPKNRHRRWICKCECGTEKSIPQTTLRRGIVSCGCARGKTSRAKLEGQRFTRLTVVRVNRNEDRTMYWDCLCDCGNTKVYTSAMLLSGHVKSCGCLKREILTSSAPKNKTHGMSKSKTYKSWVSMIQRCENQKNHNYHRYGGRGVTVCDRWRASFDDFMADMGERPDGMTLDRVDNDGSYEPGNCRWATPAEQSSNRGMISGVRPIQMTDSSGFDLIIAPGRLTDFCRENGLRQSTVSDVVAGRLKATKGWTAQYWDGQ